MTCWGIVYVPVCVRFRCPWQPWNPWQPWQQQQQFPFQQNQGQFLGF